MPLLLTSQSFAVAVLSCCFVVQPGTLARTMRRAWSGSPRVAQRACFDYDADVFLLFVCVRSSFLCPSGVSVCVLGRTTSGLLAKTSSRCTRDSDELLSCVCLKLCADGIQCLLLRCGMPARRRSVHDDVCAAQGPEGRINRSIPGLAQCGFD